MPEWVREEREGKGFEQGAERSQILDTIGKEFETICMYDPTSVSGGGNGRNEQ